MRNLPTSDDDKYQGSRFNKVDLPLIAVNFMTDRIPVVDLVSSFGLSTVVSDSAA